MIEKIYDGLPAVILGTGPSLAQQAESIRESGYIIFGVNNTFEDFDLHEWIACDPDWHRTFGRVNGSFNKWHWDTGICDRYGYQHIPGKWGTGLSLNPEYIHYNHSSGAQALNLAVLMGCFPIYLAGFDMNYEGEKRHYFSGLSDKDGEYPAGIRKTSNFDGLIACYERMGQQEGLPKIINLTKTSSLKCFDFGRI